MTSESEFGHGRMAKMTSVSPSRHGHGLLFEKLYCVFALLRRVNAQHREGLSSEPGWFNVVPSESPIDLFHY